MTSLRNLLFYLLLLSAAGTALAVEITDRTKEWTFRYDVISAFPETYKFIPKEENARIIRVFHYFQGETGNPLRERRVEVFYTGGDWMEYGLVYFVANSPNPRYSVYSDESAAYFIKAMSTPDREEGEIAPEVDPLNDESLKRFITETFLTEDGNVRDDFKPLSMGSP